MLSSAVKSLKGDKRTRTVKEQVLFYKDPKVSGFNVLTAQNQLELVFAKKRYHGLVVVGMVLITIYNLFWALTYRAHQINSVPKTYSVTKYSMQLSADGGNWSDMTCAAGLPCVFDSSTLAEKPDEIIRNVFLQEQLARFIKVLPWTWSNMEEEDLLGLTAESRPKRFPDIRLGVIGGSDTGSIPYRVLKEGCRPTKSSCS